MACTSQAPRPSRAQFRPCTPNPFGLCGPALVGGVFFVLKIKNRAATQFRKSCRMWWGLVAQEAVPPAFPPPQPAAPTPPKPDRPPEGAGWQTPAARTMPTNGRQPRQQAGAGLAMQHQQAPCRPDRREGTGHGCGTGRHSRTEGGRPKAARAGCESVPPQAGAQRPRSGRHRAKSTR